MRTALLLGDHCYAKYIVSARRIDLPLDRVALRPLAEMRHTGLPAAHSIARNPHGRSMRVPNASP
jgi:hypothetical protein